MNNVLTIYASNSMPQKKRNLNQTQHTKKNSNVAYKREVVIWYFSIRAKERKALVRFEKEIKNGSLSIWLTMIDSSECLVYRRKYLSNESICDEHLGRNICMRIFFLHRILHGTCDYICPPKINLHFHKMNDTSQMQFYNIQVDLKWESTNTKRTIKMCI